ncbi:MULTISPECIES: DapH/DapD/GlmU-related protein [Thauera]|jgi:acetyltransferase-like isoleucine patch superfamily enzyme|uniref:Putative transferase n=1 Tax=Thauera aminoaromatica S2 TaxID=1234381 RepID=N6Y0Y7_THASP|nr:MULTISPECIES: DapH/DapD/GlmU-related protein [Thauera]ENO85190.1 putative transferase [Thauera aminoaromatica S2]MBP6133091.1 acyltransferase [Thauera sp.]MBP7047567.1 acyltransferase [Thauera sp.]MCK6398993.1 acyltransferase [Thauera aminoaromatica]
MRQISLPQVGVFMALFILVLLLAAATSYWGLGSLPLGDFRGVVLLLGGVVAMYVWAFVAYRLFLKAMPLAEGELEPGSRAEFAAQVNILFYLLLFNSLIRTHFLPVPLMRLVYLALGARLGPNTYSAGTLLDPPLTEFGANCIIGHDAVLYAHAIEGSRFALARIRIGDGVTIGAMAVVMSGVAIGDGAIVSAGAVVLKDTKIGAGEVWGGVPARRLR